MASGNLRCQGEQEAGEQIEQEISKEKESSQETTGSEDSACIRTCSLCRGSGRMEAAEEMAICPGCFGRGLVDVSLPAQRCAYCLGTGQTCQGPCPACGGCGWMKGQA